MLKVGMVGLSPVWNVVTPTTGESPLSMAKWPTGAPQLPQMMPLQAGVGGTRLPGEICTLLARPASLPSEDLVAQVGAEHPTWALADVLDEAKRRGPKA